MNVLLSAIACHPLQGSEGGVGWRSAVALSREHRVHVMTSEGERSSIQKILTSGAYRNLTFTFFGKDAPYHRNRLIARLQSWTRYVNWTRQSLQVAQHLTGKEYFDLAHHVTYSSWRVPSPLWKLNIPFVWGPVGGAAKFPDHLLNKLSLHSATFEVARGFSNWKAARSSSLRACARNSAAVVASNRETFDKLAELRGTSEGLYTVFPTFFTAQQVEAIKFDASQKPAIEPLRLLTGGNIIGSKGLVFALEALALISKKGISWRLVVGGYGPEIPFLERKARDIGIQDYIHFHTGFSGDEYINKLKEAHIFILPSFRENAGITMLEAMLAGCVPVIIDASAQAAAVDSTCGFKIAVGKATDISASLANAIEFLALNPEKRVEMGRKASDVVTHKLCEKTYVRKISEIYQQALQRQSI